VRPTRVEPGPGQESVWDYPRPPRLERSDDHVTVVLGGVTIADSRRALRVLETSSPPVYYIPPGDITGGVLVPSDRTTFCEWKGDASYYDVSAAGRTERAAAWHYPAPTAPFAAIAGHVAFYPGRMEACTVNGEQVRPQPGDYYGGWITSGIVGPFKGDPGTSGW